MAKEALRVLLDGTTENVSGTAINEGNKKDKYICCGRHRSTNQLCGAHMIAYKRGEDDYYFRVAPDDHHMIDCPCDESEAAIIIKHMDVTGSNTSPEELYSDFDQERQEGRKERNERKVYGKSREGGDKEKEETDTDRPIKRAAKKPSNLKEFCAVLAKSNLDDTYSGIPIMELIVDHRNISTYRKEGFRDGQVAVVLCAKIGMDRINKVLPDREPNTVVLGDAYSYVDRAEQLLFVINGSYRAKQKIFGAKKQDIIAIFGRWYQVSPNVYACDPIKEGHVFVTRSSFFES